MSKVSAGPALLVFQGLAAVVWTYAATVPAWIFVTSGLNALSSALLLSAVLTLLGLVRYEAFGEVRRREFGTLPYLIRSIFFAAPVHALHGAVLSVFAVTWMRFDKSNQYEDEDELDEQLRRAFFYFFLHGWFFSNVFLLEKRQKLNFGRLNQTTRIQALMRQAPRLGINVVLHNILGVGLSAWDPFWLCIAFSLEFNDAILGTILGEKSRKGDLEEDEVAPAMAKMAPGTVEETFQAFPLLVQNDSWKPTLPSLLANLPVQQTSDSLKEWWLSKRKLFKVEGETTGVNASTFLIQLSNDRFDSVAQMVYRCDAVEAGSAFGKAISRLGFTSEAVRIRAYGLVCQADFSFGSRVDQWMQALNACLDLIDAQSLRMFAFSRYAATKAEPPRNPITKLDDTDAFVEAGSSSSRDLPEHELEVRRRKAKDIQWKIDHKRFIGRSYWQRTINGNLFWDFDPIYEENKRRLLEGQVDEINKALARDISEAIVPEFHLLCRASESAVILAKRKRPAAVNGGEVVSLVRLTLQRCVSASEEAMATLEKSGRSIDNVYALSFCLDRDLQDLASM